MHPVNYKSSDQIASARSDLGDCAVSADWRGRSHLACHICIEIKSLDFVHHPADRILYFWSCFFRFVPVKVLESLKTLKTKIRQSRSFKSLKSTLILAILGVQLTKGFNE